MSTKTLFRFFGPLNTVNSKIALFLHLLKKRDNFRFTNIAYKQLTTRIPNSVITWEVTCKS